MTSLDVWPLMKTDWSELISHPTPPYSTSFACSFTLCDERRLWTNLLLKLPQPLLFSAWVETLSQIFKKKKQQQHLLHKAIQVPLSYLTCQRDGIILPQRITLLNAYKVLSMSLLPSKTKETVFQVLNRTIWTQNKAYKSGLAPDACCLRCEETETMQHLLYSCENSLPRFGN
jgi:hypothetical protein